ncbi:hypothetical protein [Deinococcus fonticola]|uniref:hypothetical protein n=1 Tax=Deinococcus fonticola TaxID=2528713 RepID=UPI00107525C8|nr:hypothetical protein [Deinococcus fonticola]
MQKKADSKTVSPAAKALSPVINREVDISTPGGRSKVERLLYLISELPDVQICHDRDEDTYEVDGCSVLVKYSDHGNWIRMPDEASIYIDLESIEIGEDEIKEALGIY